MANVCYVNAECYLASSDPTSRITNSAQAKQGSVKFSTSPLGLYPTLYPPGRLLKYQPAYSPTIATIDPLWPDWR